MILVKWLSIAERYSKIYLDRLLAPLGLNSSQHIYITVICQNPGITQEEFTELTYLNPSNITRALNSLIRSGFISKETDPKDRRKNCLYPTAKAYEANRQILDALDYIKDTLLDGYSPSEKELFLKILKETALRAVALTSQKGDPHHGTNTDISKSIGT